MGNLKRVALTLATIFILSTMTGFVDNETTAEEELLFEFAKAFADQGTEVSNVDKLYEGYDCPDGRTESECADLFSLGQGHNEVLHRLMNEAIFLDAETGVSPERDLLMYDRIVLSTGDPVIIEEYNRFRDFIAHALELGAYSQNDTTAQKEEKLINGTFNNLATYCTIPFEHSEYVYDANEGSEARTICEELAGEVEPTLENALAAVNEPSDDLFIERLNPSNSLSDNGNLYFDIIRTATWATMAFWSCDEDAKPSLRDVASDGASRWCQSIDDVKSDNEPHDHSTDGETEGGEEGEISASSEGRSGHEDTSFWQSLSKKEKWKFIKDCLFLLGLLLVIIAVVASGGAVGVDILIKMGLKSPMAIMSLFVKEDVSDHFEAESACGDGIDNDLDGYTDCDDQDCWDDPICDTSSNTPNTPPTEKLGILDMGHTPNSVRLNGPEYWVDLPSGVPGNQGFFGNGYWMDCGYSYTQIPGALHGGWGQTTYAQDRLIVDSSLVQKSWTVFPTSSLDPTPSPAYSMSSGYAEFYQEGQYLITYTESHPYAVDSPQTAQRLVTVAYGCDEEVPNDTSGDVVFPSWASALHTSPPVSLEEKWYDAGLRDLGDTMKDDKWMGERDCRDEEWTCVAATAFAIKHNNYLGLLSASQDELGIVMPVYSDSYIPNIEAIIVNTDHPGIIYEYRQERASIKEENDRLMEMLRDDRYEGFPLVYAQIALALEIAKENNVPENRYSALQETFDSFNEDTVDQDFTKALRKQIESAEYKEFDVETQFALQGQLAIMTASDESVTTGGRGHGGDHPGWAKVADVGALFSFDPSTIKKGLKSLRNKDTKAADHGATGPHGGFTDDTCTEVDFEECVRGRLVAVNNFTEAKQASIANADVCGEDADLVELKTAIGKVDYKVSDPVEYVLTADCTLNGYEYKIKTEVVDSAGLSVYAEKIGIWEETDNIEVFTITIQDGLDEGTYCVNSMLFEHMNSVPISVSSGTDCFDVDPAKRDNGGGGGFFEDIPGFTGLTALIAMLGAAIVAFRRLEDQ